MTYDPPKNGWPHSKRKGDYVDAEQAHVVGEPEPMPWQVPDDLDSDERIAELEAFVKRTEVLAACVMEISLNGCSIDRTLAEKALERFNKADPTPQESDNG